MASVVGSDSHQSGTGNGISGEFFPGDLARVFVAGRVCVDDSNRVCSNGFSRRMEQIPNANSSISFSLNRRPDANAIYQ